MTLSGFFIYWHLEGSCVNVDYCALLLSAPEEKELVMCKSHLASLQTVEHKTLTPDPPIVFTSPFC